MLLRIRDSFIPSPEVYAPKLPPRWQDGGPNPAGRYWVHTPSKLRVLVSVDRLDDDSLWLHVSCSYTNRLPSWDDLKAVKRLFMGDVEAYQVLPREADYVNAHQFCLHLWCPLDGTLPGQARTGA